MLQSQFQCCHLCKYLHMVNPHYCNLGAHEAVWVFANASYLKFGSCSNIYQVFHGTNMNDVSNHTVVEGRSAFAFLSDQIYDKTGQKNSHRHALWSENPICGRSDLWSIMGLRVRVPVCVVKLVFLVICRHTNPFTSHRSLTDRVEDEYQIPSSHPVCITQPPICIPFRIPNR